LDNRSAELNCDIFLTSPDWPPESTHNGICTYVGHLREGLIAVGHKPTVLSMAGRRAGPDSSDIIDLTGVPLSRRSLAKRVRTALRSRRSWSFGIADAASRQINAAMRLLPAGRPRLLEIEESFGLAEHFVGRDFALVVRAHGPYFKGAPALGLSADRRAQDRCAAEARAIKHADGISAPSQYILDAISEEWDIEGIPTTVIPNPAVPVPREMRWQPSKSGPQKILYVGRFDRLKGADVLLDAFNMVAARHPQVELLFAGPDSGLVDDEGRRWMLREYADAHLSPSALTRLNYLGTVSRDLLHELRKGAAACVVASREENFPYAALEALGAGCPLVAARMGGVPEIVVDEQNGLLFRSGEAASLAAQLERVLEDGALAENLSAGAQASFERYSPTNVALETLRFYERVVGAQSATAPG
jgi:glycosyltransferase involved in cell wall biosynthesis